VEVRGVHCSESFYNRGSFGAQYDSQVSNIELVSGRKKDTGDTAGLFNEDSRMAIFSIGPYSGGEIISFSLWINTDESNSEMILMHYGLSWSSLMVSPYKDHLTLTLDHGVLALYIQPTLKLETASFAGSLADGKWHHIAVSMPTKNCLLSEVEIFVDGEAVNTASRNGRDQRIFQLTDGNMGIGGFGYTSGAYDRAYPDMKPFKGMIDDFSLWARPLVQEDTASPTGRPTTVSPNATPSASGTFEDGHTYGRECIKDNDGAYQEIAISNNKQCKKKCARKNACLGYELTKSPLKCIHFKQIPATGVAKMNVQCVHKVKMMH